MRYTQVCKHRKICNIVDQRVKLETKEDHIKANLLKQECIKKSTKHFIDRYEYIQSIQLKNLC